ncbi:hypothetical protein PIB30_071356 [Stylosanthes scabra]|uniref:Uncharacterized protein n=1 Tax=Stylosanthes scabra TaxID=79078 RepID=A0ABU6XPX9_9FABA|nr:hypothetical protein [Stylosanthes scabra]
MTHKKSDGSHIHEDARTVDEAIKVIESCDQSTKELSQNESLAQQQGDNLPPNIAAEMNSLGSGPSSTDTQDLQGPP